MEVAEARNRDLAVSGDDELLVVPISDVDEAGVLDRAGRREALEVVRGSGHSERDAGHCLREDQDSEVVWVRGRSPAVVGVAFVSAHLQVDRAFREDVRRQADAQAAHGECAGHEGVRAVARRQEDARGHQRTGAELAERSVRVLGQNRADVRVGRVDCPPGNRLGPRRKGDQKDDPEHPEKPRRPRTPLAERQHRNPPFLGRNGRGRH